MLKRYGIPLLLPFFLTHTHAQEMHDHPAPEKLGNVSFPISCSPSVQAPFNRAVALLPSFSYAAAHSTLPFRTSPPTDPQCAIAH